MKLHKILTRNMIPRELLLVCVECGASTKRKLRRRQSVSDAMKIVSYEHCKHCGY